MGKRELVLIVAFVLIGSAIYHVTAPPPKPGEEGFSIGRLISMARAHIRGENVEKTLVRKVQVTVPPDVERLVLAEYRGTLTITGESREDIVAELRATAYGVDDTAAQARAAAIDLRLEPHEDQVTLIVTRPEQGRRPQFELTLKVPSRLACAIGTRGMLAARGIDTLKLLDARGRVEAHGVGGVSGDLSNGSIEIVGAREVELHTDRSEVRIEQVAQGLELRARRGPVRIKQVSGPTKLELDRVDAELEELHGPAKISAQQGPLRVREIMAPIEITSEHAEIELAMTAPVPVTVEASDAPLIVRLPEAGITLDAEVEHADISVPDDLITVKEESDGRSAKSPIKGGGPTVHLRNKRGDITIR
jgi:Toastrack DUF4097